MEYYIGIKLDGVSNMQMKSYLSKVATVNEVLMIQGVATNGGVFSNLDSFHFDNIFQDNDKSYFSKCV